MSETVLIFVAVEGSVRDRLGDSYATPEEVMSAVDAWLAEQGRAMCAAVGLEVKTPEEQAVLDAAKEWAEAKREFWMTGGSKQYEVRTTALWAAVRASQAVEEGE